MILPYVEKESKINSGEVGTIVRYPRLLFVYHFVYKGQS